MVLNNKIPKNIEIFDFIYFPTSSQQPNRSSKNKKNPKSNKSRKGKESYSEEEKENRQWGLNKQINYVEVYKNNFLGKKEKKKKKRAKKIPDHKHLHRYHPSSWNNSDLLHSPT